MLIIPPSHTDEDGFNPRLWKLASKIKVMMSNVGYNVAKAPAEGEATWEQLRVFTNFILQAQAHYDLGSGKDVDAGASKLSDQFDQAIAHTESNKKKLKEKIKELGVPVYQYYAH
jgi:hypothetical protein